MTFTEAVSTVLNKYATFDGRAARSEYWWWVLFIILVQVVTNILDAMIFAPILGLVSGSAQPLSLLVSLALLIPGLAVSFRRMHDIDKSAWWLLVAFIPIVGILVLIYFFIQKGTSGSNQFGSDPLH